MPSSFSTPDSQTPLSVSQLNRQVKRLLEGHFDFIWVEGEISNLAQPGSGHWYFSLKDDTAQLRCAMFRNRNQRVRFAPRNGQQVLLRGRVSLYEGRGDFQLIVEHMEDAGAGALQRAFEELKLRLRAEGLFEPDRKQALPSFPRRIALITSPGGAVIRDLLSVFKRRYPAVELDLVAVPVQGADAAPAIAAALAIADAADFDALVLARGGGSLEDLWAFNEEIVARAMADCVTPVVSAVGHETDFTIADLVADARAPTPSAAAELLSPDSRELLLTIRGLEANLARSLQRRLALTSERLVNLRRHLRHPGERLREQAQRLDDIEQRMQRSVGAQLELRRSQLALQNLALEQQSPQVAIKQLGMRVGQLGTNIGHHGRQTLLQQQARISTLAARLQSLSPLATLQRGYAIVTDDHGVLVSEIETLKEGDTITTRLASGNLRSQVIETTKKA